VNGSNISVALVLGLGLAKLFAGAIAMGVGDWLSTAAEVDMATREKKREEW
jgi:VIT1/CCC1 family predicted Fe2+/Mn2+ transporter